MQRIEAPKLTNPTPSLPPHLPYHFDVLQSSHELLQHFKLFCDWAYRAFLSLKPKASPVQWWPMQQTAAEPARGFHPQSNCKQDHVSVQKRPRWQYQCHVCVEEREPIRMWPHCSTTIKNPVTTVTPQLLLQDSPVSLLMASLCDHRYLCIYLFINC